MSKRGPKSDYDLAKLTGDVRGKHLKGYRAGTNLALLSPEVLAAFPTDEQVNRALKSAMRRRRSA